MELTNDERKALERLRNPPRIDNDDFIDTWDTALANLHDKELMRDAMLRLFPVRTYGNLVIRWDDKITPERLVVCGWVQEEIETNLQWKSLSYRHDMFFETCTEYSTATGESDEYDYPLAECQTPRNMLEVWTLMERCGIKDQSWLAPVTVDGIELTPIDPEILAGVRRIVEDNTRIKESGE